LVAALAYRFGQLSSIGGPARPGIVHRLDRDTSGVMVVAKTDRAHLGLAKQFEQRTTEKHYTAIALGVADRDRDLIDLPIGVHPYQREKMAIRTQMPNAREARTFYEVTERYQGFCVIDARPQTGRTHQIRLHLAHIGCPVLCDRLYGGRSQITLGEIEDGREREPVVLSRQALHARRLKLRHPQTGDELVFESPLPADMAHLLDLLRQHRGIRRP
jgi:23S rRNA pseudouridine1911/1915/1917 synthase